MNFTELIMTMVQRPGYLGILGDRRVVCLNKGGYLLDATASYVCYVRLNTVDMLAVTWEAWTPEQLQAFATQKQLG
jgi:hypothetical protein